jgi:hypothetical protein
MNFSASVTVAFPFSVRAAQDEKMMMHKIDNKATSPVNKL